MNGFHYGFSFAWASSLLFFSDFGDKFSRKIFFACAVIVSAVAYTILLFTHDTIVLVIALLFMGFATPLRINTGLIYFMEMMPAHA